MTDADPGPGPEPEPHERYRWEAAGTCTRGLGSVRGPAVAVRGRAPGSASSAACSSPSSCSSGVVTALATWLAGVLLGVLSPGSSPPTATAVAVVVVLIVGDRSSGSASSPRPCDRSRSSPRPSERLADGEPGVRVRPRGPGPVRGLAASFNAMAERLDRSRDDRRALLADVTHELRTPLTVIAGGLEAMLDGVHPMDEDHVSPILAETHVMDRLLDDLRTISLAEAGALPLHREPVDLVDLGGRRARGPADRRRGEAASSSRASATPTLEAVVDPVRVREILVNLVANAVRHTGAGGRVSVEVRASEADAVLTVTDNGEGIAPDELGRVFDRFHRRSDSGGSGLGLTIVRDLATAHGGTRRGRERRRSRPRVATFRVRLRRATALAGGQATRRAPRRSATSRTPTTIRPAAMSDERGVVGRRGAIGAASGAAANASSELLISMRLAASPGEAGAAPSAVELRMPVVTSAATASRLGRGRAPRGTSEAAADAAGAMAAGRRGRGRSGRREGRAARRPRPGARARVVGQGFDRHLGGGARSAAAGAPRCPRRRRTARPGSRAAGPRGRRRRARCPGARRA